MDRVTNIIDRLACFPRVLSPLVTGLSRPDLRFKPDANNWSILEVLGHLADEEERDFCPRLKATLTNNPWEPIDPEHWAATHKYNEQSAPEVLARFSTRRERNIAWLTSLQSPDWSAAHEHPTLGPIRAGDLLAAWVDHDALHLRQIAKRLHDLAHRDANGYSTLYAGSW